MTTIRFYIPKKHKNLENMLIGMEDKTMSKFIVNCLLRYHKGEREKLIKYHEDEIERLKAIDETWESEKIERETAERTKEEMLVNYLKESYPIGGIYSGGSEGKLRRSQGFLEGKGPIKELKKMGFTPDDAIKKLLELEEKGDADVKRE